MTEFVPQNDLEQALVDGRSGRLPLADFIRLLLRSPIYVLSGAEPKEDGTGFEPLLYPHPDEPEQMISCFSAPSRIGEHATKAPFVLQVITGEFLERLENWPGIGVVINPGQTFGFELRSPAIQSLVASIKVARTN